MGLSWPARDPGEVLDYEVNWAKWLAGDTIASSLFTFVQQAGLVIQSQDKTATTSIVWLTGGSSGQQAILKCYITTAGGRTKDTLVSIVIR